MATLNDYVTEVSFNIPTISTIAQADIFRAINRARKDLAESNACTMNVATINTVASQNYNYLPLVNIGMQSGSIVQDFPSFIYNVYSYMGTVKYELGRMMIDEEPFANYYGYPIKYWIKSAPNVVSINPLITVPCIYYYPIPSSVYTIDIKYTIIPADMTALSDVEIAIPPQFFQAVSFLASKHLAIKDGNMALAQVMDQDYKAKMTEIQRGLM